MHLLSKFRHLDNFVRPFLMLSLCFTALAFFSAWKCIMMSLNIFYLSISYLYFLSNIWDKFCRDTISSLWLLEGSFLASNNPSLNRVKKTVFLLFSAVYIIYANRFYCTFTNHMIYCNNWLVVREIEMCIYLILFPYGWRMCRIMVS